MKGLENKVAVITGGGGVFGSMIAGIMASNGAKVVVLGRNQEPLDEVVAEIEARGGLAMGIACDVMSRDQLINTREKLEENWGPCDILVNNAGGNHPLGTTSAPFFDPSHLEDDEMTSFFDLEQEGMEFVFNLNFLGVFLASQVFGKGMIGRENPHIINISSVSAFQSLSQIPAYSAAKAAVSNFTQWMAVHFAKSGIRVNAMAPGFFCYPAE